MGEMTMAGFGFNEARDIQHAHTHPVLDRVMHVVHAHWHGVRSATACAPGLKLLIPHEEHLDGEAMRHVYGLITKFDVRKIVFQSYSDIADTLARDMKKRLGPDVDLYVVTHVTSAQFEHHFEMRMLSLIRNAYHLGVFKRIASVKPNFTSIVPEYWPETIINYMPNIGLEFDGMMFDPSAVFVPIENTWRKNLYTNILAACNTEGIEQIYTVNWPSALETLADLSRLQLVGYKRGLDLLTTLGSVSAVLAVTLAECQPMTQLEAFALGTPALTGPLGLAEFAGHELTRVCEVPHLDNPALISQYLKRIIDLRISDPAALAEMIADYNQLRARLAEERYLMLLDL